MKNIDWSALIDTQSVHMCAVWLCALRDLTGLITERKSHPITGRFCYIDWTGDFALLGADGGTVT